MIVQSNQYYIRSSRAFITFLGALNRSEACSCTCVYSIFTREVKERFRLAYVGAPDDSSAIARNYFRSDTRPRRLVRYRHAIVLACGKP